MFNVHLREVISGRCAHDPSSWSEQRMFGNCSSLVVKRNWRPFNSKYISLNASRWAHEPNSWFETEMKDKVKRKVKLTDTVFSGAVCIPALISNCNDFYFLQNKSPADFVSSDRPDTIAMRDLACKNYASYQHLRLCKPKWRKFHLILT